MNKLKPMNKISSLSSTSSLLSSSSSSKSIQQKNMHTASNKKWYVRNKRLQAEQAYLHHAVPHRVWMEHQLAKNTMLHTRPQIQEMGIPTPHIINPLTSVIFRQISYLHVIGPREQTRTKILKQGFKTSNDDIESQRFVDEFENEHQSNENNTDRDTFAEEINPLREQERLMELDLSASAIRNTQRPTIESHQHLLHSDTLSLHAPFVKSNHQSLGTNLFTRNFFMSTWGSSGSSMNSSSLHSTSTSSSMNSEKSSESTAQKLEHLDHERSDMRSRLREKSFDSDDLMDDEMRLNELDSSASAVRSELHGGSSVNEDTKINVSEEKSQKFQARAYDDLEEAPQSVVDEDFEATSSFGSSKH